ncbi:Gfo/Idh/MocA family protein [Desulfolucanica intricata]|uniref:Gfo/Idh/MocA family protein n=1 Tax=Desulfolucanica intricata TaxID=1285191 RepID=UPI00082C86AE|nr:Gfo/Idh/MocA family oxidoreductase [Desulfolucanica intricata]
MKKIRLGIIGTGMALEKLHYPALQQLSDKYEIAALCDIKREKALAWANRLKLNPGNVYTDYKEIARRPDIDAFDIMVPIELNYIVTEAVASIARKPIICEKPLAPTPEQARAHAELPKKYGIPIMIAENYRHNEEINMLRDMVRNKKVGDIVYFIQNRVVFFPGDMYKDKFPATEWRQHPDFPGGAILDTALHDLAALRHIFGPVKSLQAFGVPQNDDFSPYAVINVNIKFNSGVIGQFAFYCAGKEMQRPLVGLRIFGKHGMIFLEERDCGIINVAFNDGHSEQIPYQVQRGYYNELLNFYNAVIGKEPLSVTPETELGDTLMVFDILRSIREEAVVPVDKAEDLNIPHFAFTPEIQNQPQLH